MAKYISEANIFFLYGKNWEKIARHQYLSDEFIDKHFEDMRDYIAYLESFQKLSEQLIEKYSSEWNWSAISEYQKLSETFIEKHQNQVDWVEISFNQKMSIEFLNKHYDKLNWFNIFLSRIVQEDFIEKHVNNPALKDRACKESLQELYL